MTASATSVHRELWNGFEFFYVPKQSIICQNVAIVIPSTDWENDGEKLFADSQDGELFATTAVSSSFALPGFSMSFQNLTVFIL